MALKALRPFNGRLFVAFSVLLTILLTASASAQRLDRFALKRWKKLRETERYQLQIAEKYYREKKWKIAASEYEKYLTLYEQSEAAAFAQLKWSLCQVSLRKSNTAIKEGFQSVIDYWPDSTEAISASYYIGSTYRGMGRMRKAKSAYRKVLSKHPQHIVSIYSLNDLVDIATVQKDWDGRAEIWKKLTFEVKRTKQNRRVCERASQQLATYRFSQAAFGEAVEALHTTNKEEKSLVDAVVYYIRSPVNQLVRDSKTKAKGAQLCEQAVAFIRQKIPAGTDEESKKRVRQMWYYMSDIYRYGGLTQKERKVYTDMAAKLGTDDTLLSYVAGWYKRMSKREDARATYRKYKNRINGLSQVAYSYREERKPKPAVTIYRQLAGLDPKQQVKWVAEVAGTFYDNAKYKEAIDTYQELQKLDVENTQKWLYATAYAYQRWGKYKQAIGHYRQCTNFPENYKQMAYCHRRLKQHREAIILYGQVAAHAPSAP